MPLGGAKNEHSGIHSTCQWGLKEVWIDHHELSFGGILLCNDIFNFVYIHIRFAHNLLNEVCTDFLFTQ